MKWKTERKKERILFINLFSAFSYRVCAYQTIASFYGRAKGDSSFASLSLPGQMQFVSWTNKSTMSDSQLYVRVGRERAAESQLGLKWWETNKRMLVGWGNETWWWVQIFLVSFEDIDKKNLPFFYDCQISFGLRAKTRLHFCFPLPPNFGKNALRSIAAEGKKRPVAPSNSHILFSPHSSIAWQRKQERKEKASPSHSLTQSSKFSWEDKKQNNLCYIVDICTKFYPLMQKIIVYLCIKC